MTAESDTLPETSPVEAQEAEVQTEEVGHYITAALCGKPVRVVPANVWRMSWQRMTMQGRFDDFAEKVLHPDDLDLYFDLDPTLEEFTRFVNDVAEMGGESLGKSAGPRPSSRRTRKR